MFQKTYFRKNIKTNYNNCKKIRDGKLQSKIKREAVKISNLSWGKTDKYKYLTGGEILPFGQWRIKKQSKFTYYSLGKAFEKQTKNMLMLFYWNMVYWSKFWITKDRI